LTPPGQAACSDDQLAFLAKSLAAIRFACALLPFSATASRPGLHGMRLAKGSPLKCESLLFSFITVTDKGLRRRKPVRAHTYQPTSLAIWQWEFPKDFPGKPSCVLLRPMRARCGPPFLSVAVMNCFYLGPLE
jgi:hypothetical protein